MILAPPGAGIAFEPSLLDLAIVRALGIEGASVGELLSFIDVTDTPLR